MAQATLLKIHPDNPQMKAIAQAVDVLKKGGLVIYPTDTIYGLGCDLHNVRAVERLCQIRGLNPAKANLSFICHDLTHISDYAKISTQTYKVMKKALPGPFTFVLEASSKVPKIGGSRRKTVGIRVPDNKISQCLVEELGNPIISTSIHDEDEVIEYTTDPELIYEKYRNLVDLVIDGGYGNNVASTVVNCENDEFEVLRQGAGEIDEYL
ncbi:MULTISPECIES: L-threonylcarbamoyladenylate synthase [Rufibacter]|uniref:tRNA threonylcarbamoyl adenosine modification protein (Sua5/YciO/YrdC/YwlC family) n=1 Tax=Rufibacter quisquiliarum TaxID=1549639 RepID=A0A839GL40_9BACT|nr:MULTISPECIES: L-threonylcarbamoyladenylate synthase [Rufibacter]MBA9075667.1 tRNA threonylcarbamoyl adenosine modification protein (Sua5/YciO/YrdC/YwlC family) [Rufibacter quisquiliarum]